MEKIIVFQGDSITDAGRAKDNDISVGVGYANLVKAHLSANEPYQYQFYNRGISGNRVVDLYARIKIDMINTTLKDLNTVADIIDEALENERIAIVGSAEHLEAMEEKPKRIIKI